MSLEDIVQVTISSSGRGVSRAGFGIPMVVAKHSNFNGLFKQYNLGTATADMLVDGFLANDPAFRAVSALARNTPKPTKVIVGKLLTDFNQTFSLTVQTIIAIGGEQYSFNIVGPDGTVFPITYTTSPGDTESVIAIALDAQVTAVTNLASTPAAGVISAVADNSNEMFLVTSLDVTTMEFLETTVDSNLVTEVTNIAAQNDDWYGLILADPRSIARVTALAGYVETREKIFGVTTSDTDTGDPVSTTDLAFLLNAAQFFRTFPLYSGDQGKYGAATWMGNGFPFTPGSQTWAFKPLSGVVADILPSGFQTALDAKSCNYYVAVAGVPVTNGGEATGGRMASKEFIDVIRGRDKLTARLRENIFGLLINARKVPFTQAGIDAVVAQVEATLNEAIGEGYLSPDVPEGQDKPFIITAPLISEISQADKIARTLPNVNFECTLAGAIHAVKINGVISV